MGRLIEPEMSPTGQRNGGRFTPAGALDFGTLNPLVSEGSDLGVEIVAHPVKNRAQQVMTAVLL